MNRIIIKSYIEKSSNLINKFFLLILISIWPIDCIYSQENDIEFTDSTFYKFRYGAFIDGGLNLFLSDFQNLPGVPNCCTGFKSGNGIGFSIGGLLMKPISQDILASARLGFNMLNGNYKVDESFYPIIDGISTKGKFQHNLSAKLNSVELSILGSFRFSGDLFITGGLKFPFLITKRFEQYEKIVEPVDKGTFSDGTRVHNEYSGELPDANSFNTGLTLGFSYSLPLNRKKSLFLNPEFFYTYYFLPVVQDLNWNINTFRLGVSVYYKVPPPPPPPPPPPLDPPDPLMSEFPIPPGLSVSVAVIQLDSNQNEMNDFDIKIEDFISLNLRPLLNYIFFDEDSSSIPARYYQLTRDEIIDFNNRSLENLSVLQTYYNLLNVIGRRLRENPSSKIELVGTNSNINNEKDNKALSELRALNIRNYFRDVWSVEESRMKITVRNLPKEHSDSKSIDGRAENRRVEILSNDNILLEPVVTTDTLREFHDYFLRFFPSVKSDAGLKNWNLTIIQGKKILKQFSGFSKVPDSLDWHITPFDTSAPKQGGQIYYTMTAEDSIGQFSKSPVNWIPVDQLTIEQKRLSKLEDKEFEYFSLILFDFGKSKLDKKHKSVLNFVRSRIKPESEVTISGYTDQIGDEKVNRKISQKRASEAAKQLKLKNVNEFGVGESELLYDNLLPEGRFYCRTVKITIENPVVNNK